MSKNVYLRIESPPAAPLYSFGRAVDGPFDMVSAEVFAYIRDKTLPQSIIIFMRLRALRFFTGRDTFMTQRCADLGKGDYVLIHKTWKESGKSRLRKLLPAIPA
jgi:hypothetical protein